MVCVQAPAMILAFWQFVRNVVLFCELWVSTYVCTCVCVCTCVQGDRGLLAMRLRMLSRMLHGEWTISNWTTVTVLVGARVGMCEAWSVCVSVRVRVVWGVRCSRNPLLSGICMWYLPILCGKLHLQVLTPRYVTPSCETLWTKLDVLSSTRCVSGEKRILPHGPLWWGTAGEPLRTYTMTGTGWSVSYCVLMFFR